MKHDTFFFFNYRSNDKNRLLKYVCSLDRKKNMQLIVCKITDFKKKNRVVPKVIIEKSLSGKFLWNRNWDLGWIWAGWHYWKKTIGPIMSNFWGRFFQVFVGQKKKKNIVACALKSCLQLMYGAVASIRVAIRNMNNTDTVILIWIFILAFHRC